MAKRNTRQTAKKTESKESGKPATAGTKVASREHLARVTRDSPEVAYALVQDVLDRHKSDLLKIPGVVGLDVGPKVQNARPTLEFAIIVYVKNKSPKRLISTKEYVPALIESVPTDVIEQPRFESAVAAGVSGAATAAPPGTPYYGGSRIESSENGAGTMGIDVRLNRDDFPVRLLTCAHILSRADSPCDARPNMSSNGRDVGHFDGIDCAFDEELDFALIEPPLDWPDELAGLAPIATTPTIITRVWQSDMFPLVRCDILGAQSGKLRQGLIRSIDSPRLPISDKRIGEVEGQILIEMADGKGLPFVRPGDSGAAVVIEDRLVGLIRGASVKTPSDPVDGRYAIACHLSQIAMRSGGLSLAK